jgi:hypothetical protein
MVLAERRKHASGAPKFRPRYHRRVKWGRVRWALLLFCSTALAQSGTDLKPKFEDYEVHGQSKDVGIGAEFMIHSFSGQGQTYIAKDFLVVEVALYPPKGESINVNEGSFALRVNGKKQLLQPVPPQMVATRLQRPDWQTGPRLEGGGGLGNAGVILGRPRPPQIPGAPEPRGPTQPRAPDPEDRSGIDREPPVPAHELVVRTALPEGPHKAAVSGFLYFPYKGKTTSIKSLELLFEDAVIKLR